MRDDGENARKVARTWRKRMTASCSHESSGLGAFFAAAEADDLDRVNEKKPIAASGARSCLTTSEGGDVVVTSPTVESAEKTKILRRPFRFRVMMPTGGPRGTSGARRARGAR